MVVDIESQEKSSIAVSDMKIKSISYSIQRSIKFLVCTCFICVKSFFLLLHAYVHTAELFSNCDKKESRTVNRNMDGKLTGALLQKEQGSAALLQ